MVSAAPTYHRHFLQHREVIFIIQHIYINLYSSLEAARGLVLANSVEENYSDKTTGKSWGKQRASGILESTYTIHPSKGISTVKRKTLLWEDEFTIWGRNNPMHVTNMAVYPKPLTGEGPWDLTDMNEECFHLAQSESECTCRYSMFPGRNLWKCLQKRSCKARGVAWWQHVGTKGWKLGAQGWQRSKNHGEL